MRRLALGPAALPRSARAMLTALAVCGAAAGPAVAEDGGSHLLDSALKMMNLKTDPGPMPDFVRQSRHGPGQDDYIPAGATPGVRPLKLKTPAEVKSLTAELDAARAAQVAGRRPKAPTAAAGGPARRGKPLALDHKAEQATNR